MSSLPSHQSHPSQPSQDQIEARTNIIKLLERSFDMNELDHKWAARNYLQKYTPKFHTERRERQRVNLEKRGPEPDPLNMVLMSLARSAFDYAQEHAHVLDSDRSLKAISNLCSDDGLIFDVSEADPEVFRLSRVFNEIIDSNRKLHKCYDCGTNARAMFLKLVEVNRGVAFLSFEEQARMKLEYAVTRERVAEEIDRCHKLLAEAPSDAVFIMSLGLQDFGHVWVIEKRFLDGLQTGTDVRYHHYQSSFKSHLIADFIERMDYGRDPYQSLDIDRFFVDLKRLLTYKEAWTEEYLRLFCRLFAFSPVNPIKKPDPGFSFTYVIY